MCCDWTPKLGGVTRSDEKETPLKVRIYFLEGTSSGGWLRSEGALAETLASPVPGGDLKELSWLNSWVWSIILAGTLD